MKNMNKTNLLSIVFLLTSSFFISSREAQKNEDSIELQWISDSDLKREEEIFVSSFLEGYKDFPEAKSKTKQNRKEGLKNAFEKERIEFKKSNGKILLVSAKKNSEVVGFALFNKTENKGEIYIRQLAVAPEYWKQGIGKQLVFSINKKINGIKKYVLVTRRINIGAKNFYTKLGFKESEYEHEGLDPKQYVGYELAVEGK